MAGLKAGNYLGDAGDYTGYGNTIASIVPSYASLVPVPYNSGGGGGSILPSLSNAQAATVAVGLIAAAALAAYTIHPKPLRRLRRRAA